MHVLLAGKLCLSLREIICSHWIVGDVKSISFLFLSFKPLGLSLFCLQTNQDERFLSSPPNRCTLQLRCQCVGEWTGFEATVETGTPFNYVHYPPCMLIIPRTLGTPPQYLAHDKKRFPNGIAHITDKIHELELKVGIYSSARARYEGSSGYEQKDADVWASWGC